MLADEDVGLLACGGALRTVDGHKGLDTAIGTEAVGDSKGGKAMELNAVVLSDPAASALGAVVEETSPNRPVQAGREGDNAIKADT
jgi:hypothetical protein